jgi:hypothetical protein
MKMGNAKVSRVDAPEEGKTGKGASSTRADKTDPRNWTSAAGMPGVALKLALTTLFPSLLSVMP